MHALLPLVTDVWLAALPELEEVRATARWPDVLRRVDPGLHPNLLHEVAREASRLAEGWEHGRPPGLLVPPLPPAAGGVPPPPTPSPPPASRRARLGLVTFAGRVTTVQQAQEQ